MNPDPVPRRDARVVSRCAALAACAAAWLCAGAAGAQTRDVRVVYDDLNLATDAGIDALYRRLQNAADRICVTDDPRRELRRRSAEQACRRDALAGAVRQIGHPGLTRRHEVRGSMG